MKDFHETPPGSEFDNGAPDVIFESNMRRPHLEGGGSLLVSIIVHGVFVILAVLIIWRTTMPEEDTPPPFLPGGTSGGGKVSSKIAMQKERAVSHAQPRMRFASPVRSTWILPKSSASVTLTPSLMTLPSGGAGSRSGPGPGGPGEGVTGKWGRGPGPLQGHVSLPPALRSRCSPAERAQKMRDNGGTEPCEAAVKRSLKWLKEKQNGDGSWGESHKGGMTGLALLTFLGHCETAESSTYGESVIKGLTYLMELAQRNRPPFDGIYSGKPAANSSTYEHGIAAYAMGEMYSFSKLGTRPIPGLRESFEKGVGIIINKQNPQGAWGYKDGIGYDPYGRDDLSVTGWQFQALKAAKHTNLSIPGLPAAVKKVEKYLESTQTADGEFGDPDRTHHYNQWNLTGAALLGLQTLGSGNAGKINKGSRWLVNQTEKEPLDWNRDCYLYTWYYNTQALFQKGGASWKVWNDQFQPILIENQNDDGSYKVEGSGEVGAAGSGAAGADKDVYRVCLCTLMLEVYYRYLKVGDRESERSGGLPAPK